MEVPQRLDLLANTTPSISAYKDKGGSTTPSFEMERI